MCVFRWGVGRTGGCQQALVNLTERPESTALQLSRFLYQFTSTFHLSLMTVHRRDSGTDRWVSWPFGSFFPPSAEHLLCVRCYAGNPQEYMRTRGMGSPACHSGGRGYIWVNINQHSFWSWKEVFKITHTLLFCQQLTVVLWLESSEEEINEKP